jgi:hypothetical protein
MASWSAKRRFTYAGIVIFILTILFGLFFFQVFYKAPTCNDGNKNGDEKGVDCGGSCKNLCTSDALNPIVLWSKIFNISGDVYSAVAYIENPNINSKNSKAKYKFNIFGTDNKLITTIEGETSIPKNKKFAVFETGIIIKNSKPKSTDFEFTSLSLTYSTLLKATTSPRITGTIANNSTQSFDQVELVVLVQDSNENVVAAGRSFVDNLYQKTSQDFVFTWPKPFNLGVEACVSSADIVLALDRSGSMRSEGNTPPEPFTTVLNTAKDFISNLSEEDSVAVSSFGNNSKLESLLSINKDTALNAISNMFLSSTSEQTNISGGLTESWNELASERVRPDSKKVIILLTDGVPTEPTDPNIPDFPIFSAQQVVKNIIESKTEVYTIGLGKNVNETFLKSISTNDSHYFLAPTKDDLGGIYKKINQSICTKKPNAITVIYRILD